MDSIYFGEHLLSTMHLIDAVIQLVGGNNESPKSIFTKNRYDAACGIDPGSLRIEGNHARQHASASRGGPAGARGLFQCAFGWAFCGRSSTIRRRLPGVG